MGQHNHLNNHLNGQKMGTMPIALVIIAGLLIAHLGFGYRSAFGMFLTPMTSAHDWTRADFALAMAVQNLFWGLAMPFAGWLADRFGAAIILAIGGVIYGLGMVGMAFVENSFAFLLFAGIITGVGVALSAFAIVISALAKRVGADKRSLIMGLGTAAGSSGQVVFSPLAALGIATIGWQDTLVFFALSSLAIIPLAFVLRRPKTQEQVQVDPVGDLGFSQIMKLASGHSGYILLTIGFFVCGFQVAFISVHMPAYIVDLGMNIDIAAYSLALIGLFNIIGSLAAGWFGGRHSMRGGLAFIYFARTIATIGLLLLPKTPTLILVFSMIMGLLWLSTVPLTNGIIAKVFGVKWLASLFGIVFLSHQIGSFAGVWLGGFLYDYFGSYDGMWWASVGFGLFATLVHLPIDERPYQGAPTATKKAASKPA